MPDFQWFAVPEDMGPLVTAALSHPKRPEGLCIVERVSPNPHGFFPHYEYDDQIRIRAKVYPSVLFTLDRDLAGLCIEKDAEFLGRETMYSVNLNQTVTVVQVGIPKIFRSEGHLLVNPSRMFYFPTKWCRLEERRVKAPPETAAIFRFLRTRIKDVAKPGPLGQLMTPAVLDKITNSGLLFAKDHLWYDASGAVRGSCYGKSGFAGG
jgi:hypothetical protein